MNYNIRIMFELRLIQCIFIILTYEYLCLFFYQPSKSYTGCPRRLVLMRITTRWKKKWRRLVGHTICPRSNYPFYTVNYYIEWVTTSWTDSTVIRNGNNWHGFLVGSSSFFTSAGESKNSSCISFVLLWKTGTICT